jgi:hypothetical protein
MTFRLRQIKVFVRLVSKLENNLKKTTKPKILIRLSEQGLKKDDEQINPKSCGEIDKI